MSTFNQLISPITSNDFFEKHWTKSPLHIQGEEDKFDSLFHWKAFNELLNTHYKHLDFPDIRMVLDTKRVKEELFLEKDDYFVGKDRVRKYLSPQKVQKLSKRGATTVIASVHEMDSNLQTFTHELTKELGEDRININAYFSKDGVKAFKQHYDPYDIFILQVEGKKTWHLYDYTDEYPLYGLHRPSFHDSPPFSHAITLTKGDVLYMPRGFWHAAVAEGEDSLHLTMGIMCKTGVDFFSWLLQEELRHQPIFRKNLPITYNAPQSEGLGKDELDACLPEMRTKLLEILDDTERLAQKYNEYLVDERGKHSNTAENPFNFP